MCGAIKCWHPHYGITLIQSSSIENILTESEPQKTGAAMELRPRSGQLKVTVVVLAEPHSD